VQAGFCFTLIFPSKTAASGFEEIPDIYDGLEEEQFDQLAEKLGLSSGDSSAMWLGLVAATLSCLAACGAVWFKKRTN